jgi:hypothetical protein
VKWKIKESPQRFDTRLLRGIAFIPQRIGGMKYWMEYVYWEEIMDWYAKDWIFLRWITKKEWKQQKS